MNVILNLMFFSLISCCVSCGAKVPAGAAGSGDTLIAFPGAEGFGKYATGGRGGKVRVVSNLQDDGAGSLRAALSTKKAAIVVFTVAGTIHLESPLEVHANTTIAGHSAPGDGICVADQPVILKGDNIVIRYMRFRMGDRYQDKGKVQGSGSDDALGGTRRKHIIIDHCSLSWSTDEVLSVYAGDSSSIQWNLIAEPLNYSYHFEEGGSDYQRHGYGGILGGRHLSVHHNLYAHCQSRTPRLEGNRNILPDTERVDYRNNVLYNWGGNNVYGGEGGQYNLIGNYYKFGPNTSSKVKHQVANPFKGKNIPYGSYYINLNYVDGSVEHTLDNWRGVTMENGNDRDAGKARQVQPFEVAPVHTQPALDAYELVLKGAGASFRRDTLDERIIREVRTRTGRIIDVQGGFPHGTPYETSRSAWPLLRTGAVSPDSDGDGMPDEWERRNRLNPSDGTDASGTDLHSFYTNIEVYLNSLLP